MKVAGLFPVSKYVFIRLCLRAVSRPKKKKNRLFLLSYTEMSFITYSGKIHIF